MPFVNFSSFVANFLFVLNRQHFIKRLTKNKTPQHHTGITLCISISLWETHICWPLISWRGPKVEKSLGRKAGINVRIIHQGFNCFCCSFIMCFKLWLLCADFCSFYWAEFNLKYTQKYKKFEKQLCNCYWFGRYLLTKSWKAKSAKVSINNVERQKSLYFFTPIKNKNNKMIEYLIN